MTRVQNLRVRPMQEGDLARVLEIARALPEAPQWPEEVYQKAMNPDERRTRISLVAENPAAAMLLGFAIAGIVPPEAELETIAVDGTAQRRGVGRILFAALANQLRAGGARDLNLEVRVSNARAIRFYGAIGFRETGRRPRYYRNPDEEAVLMSLRLG
jgi:[ribosomal protein S18]-alanine N-acetyltransferase